MTKEELSCGNVVKTRRGEKFIFNYIEGKPYFICLDGAGFNPAKYYKNDLSIGNTNGEYDIMKVYKNYTCQELIWERKEKPKLTEEERIILKNINEHFEYIARNEDNRLYLYEKKPRKIDYGWQMNNDRAYFVDFYMYDNLFQFIQWGDEEPYLIEDLLKEEDDE